MYCTIQLSRMAQKMEVHIVVLMGLNMFEYQPECEVRAVDQNVFKDIGVLALCQESKRRKMFHLVKSTKAVQVDSRHSRKSWVERVDSQ